MDKGPFIAKKPGLSDDTDYQQLQRSALETIQRLSGNVWTDFNEHDPGVTIMDALNYALTELNYKCSFPLEDYLCDNKGDYNPDSYGLFRPDQVYPSAPVTEKDYCKLIFDSVDEVIGLWRVKANNALPGITDFVIDLAPTVNESELKNIHKKIFSIYHQNRNLCENLGHIHFRKKERLDIAGEIELDENADVSETLARVYFTCAKYFNPGIKYLDLREYLNSDFDWSELLDGPLLNNGVIDDSSILPAKTIFFVSDLHFQVRMTKGVKVVKNLFLSGKDDVYSDELHCKDIFHSFMIRFPDNRNDVQLLLIKGKKEARFNYDEVLRWFKKLIIDEYGTQNQYAGLKGSFGFPKGIYNNFPNYSSIQNDFPNFYGINDKGIPGYYDDKRKAQAKQLKAYLLGFDFALATSMQELDSAHHLLSLDEKPPASVLPDLSDSVSHWDELFDGETRFVESESITANKVEAKNSIFDQLDSIYGEKSWLPSFSEFDSYKSLIHDPFRQIKLRAEFLKNEPSIIHSRAKACDITVEDPGNVAGLKKWISLLMGLSTAYDLPVTNVFSKFSLRLLNDTEFYNNLKGLLNIDFVINNLNENFIGESVFDVPRISVPDPTESYKKFKQRIYLLNHNLIFESFLRNGIHVENYKIIQPETDLFLLAYHSEEQSEWIGLGRFENREEAVMTANQLCNFLLYLNKQSENFYLIEHLLLAGDKEDEGYSIRVNDEEEMVFSLLKPVSRNNVYLLKSDIEKTLENTELFEIRETENKRYVIYFETGENNALYCLRTFGTHEDANVFLKAELQTGNLSLKIFYQHDDAILLPSDFMDFGLTVVFPDWSARFYNKKFRKWCEEQIAERIPAHLKVNFLWIDSLSIRQFEKLYFAWKSALVSGISLTEKSKALTSFLNEYLTLDDGE